MERRCAFSVDELNYDTETQFVSYVVQQQDGIRFLILQYQRGNGDEQFSIIKVPVLSFARREGVFDGNNAQREYQNTYNIASKEEAYDLITREGTNFHMNIVSKQHLDGVLLTFQATSLIRATGAAQALNILCEPVRKLTGIEINPVELTADVADIIKYKEAQGFCLIL